MGTGRTLVVVGAVLVAAWLGWLVLKSPAQHSDADRGTSTAEPATLPGHRVERDAEAVSAPDVPIAPEGLPDVDGALLSGTVVDPGAAVVSGAVVRATRLGELDDDETASSVTTGDDGRFAFAGLSPGSYALQATAPGVGTAALPLVRVREGVEVDVVLRLEAALAIAGRVVADEDGAPIVGATVRIDRAAPLRTLLDRVRGPDLVAENWLAVTTAADGRFRLAPCPAGGATLDVAAPGRLTTSVGVPAVPADDVVIQLRPAARLRGTVFLTGEPLPAEIAILAPREEAIPVTAPETEFALDGLAPGRLEVIVRAVGFGEASARVELIAGRETVAPPFVLLRGTEVRGRVLETGTDAPIPGAAVTLSWVRRTGSGWSSASETSLATDTQGAWSAHLRPGEWSVDVQHRGHAALGLTDPEDAIRHVGTEPESWTLHLDPAPAIVGRVTHPDGVPVVGATVEVVSAGANAAAGNEEGPIGISDQMEATTDADGAFRIEGVVTYGEYSIAVEALHGDRVQVDDVVFEHGAVEARADVVLERVGAAGALVGRVDDESGRPVVGALVSVAGNTATTESDGSFRIDGLLPGGHSARVAALGYALRVAGPFDIAAGAAADAGVLVLRRHGLSVSGRVVTPDGSGIPDTGVLVWFWLPGGRPLLARARAGPDGAFRVEGPDVPPREVDVQVRARGYPFASQRVTPDPNADVEFVLTREAEVNVAVTFEGAAPERVVLQLLETRWQSWWPLNTSFDAEHGTARATNVRPGPTRFRMTAEGYAPGGFQEADVPAGGTLELSPIHLTAGGVLAGRIVDAAAQPLVEVQVALSDQFLHIDTDADGRFVLPLIPPGTWRFNLNGVPGHDESPSFTAEIREGERTEVNWIVR